MAVSVDWKALAKSLGGIFSEAVEGMLEAGANDLSKDGFAYMLGELAAEAIRSGDPKMKEMVKANIPWLLQYYRLKAINVANDAIGKLFDLVTNVASKILGGIIP